MKLAWIVFLAAFAVPVFCPTLKAEAPAKRVEIEARKFAFAPSEITLKRGQPVVLVLKNKDVAHGLRVRDLNINMKAKAGETAEYAFTPDKTGVFVGMCSVFCGEEHGEMTIRIRVIA